ncbi:MAG TPA: MAPEG family protein [Xanthobacteraceae bacterium]|nr:MAPEG family protein [Xanthobacteraceae bacterium]
MMIQAILIPLFVQVALTFALLFAMAGLRTRDIKSGAVDRHRIALREPNWPTRTTQVANSFANQFEVPVLFYVLVILLIVLHHADLIFVILAWIFVLTRIVHAFIHVTDNEVLWRGQAYGVGVLVLFVMWVIFAVEILSVI